MSVHQKFNRIDPIEIRQWKEENGSEKICRGQRCRYSHFIPRKLSMTLNSIQKFFLQEFNHLGLDGHGKMVPSEIGWDKENAVWTPSEGNYKLVFHNRYALDPAVVAHEYTHGVMTMSCPLRYYKESGALNESIADVMGISFRRFSTGKLSWKIGDRDMSLFSSMDYYLHTEDDHGGVHTNSRIPNHAFYLAVMKVSNVIQVAKIWFSALKQCSSTASFKEFAMKTVEIANEKTQPEEIAIKILAAWETVKVLNVIIESSKFWDSRTGSVITHHLFQYY